MFPADASAKSSRSPTQDLNLLLQGPIRRSASRSSAECTAVGPSRLPSSTSAFFIHEYRVVKRIP